MHRLFSTEVWTGSIGSNGDVAGRSKKIRSKKQDRRAAAGATAFGKLDIKHNLINGGSYIDVKNKAFGKIPNAFVLPLASGI